MKEKPVALVWNEKYKAWMFPFEGPQAYYGYETPGYKGRPWTQAGGTVYNPVSVCHTGDFGYGSDYEILFGPPFCTEKHFTQKEMLKYGK